MKKDRINKFLSTFLVATTAVTMTIGMAVPAFAAEGDVLSDAEDSVSVKGLTQGDTADFIQLVYFDADGSEQLSDGMDKVMVKETKDATTGQWAWDNSADAKAISLEQIVDGISIQEAGAITTAIKTYGAPITVKSGVPTTANDEGSYTATLELTKDADNKVVTGKATDTTYTPGLYYVKIKSGTADVIYSPVFVSADYRAGKNVFTVTDDKSYQDESEAKKTTVSLKKTADTDSKSTDLENSNTKGTYDEDADYDHQVGDTVHFKLNTTVPAYTDEYTSFTFKITDKLSKGLDKVRIMV